MNIDELKENFKTDTRLSQEEIDFCVKEIRQNCRDHSDFNKASALWCPLLNNIGRKRADLFEIVRRTNSYILNHARVHHQKIPLGETVREWTWELIDKKDAADARSRAGDIGAPAKSIGQKKKRRGKKKNVSHHLKTLKKHKTA